MTIHIGKFEIDLIALIVYIISTVLITQIVKKKFFKDKTNIAKLFLSIVVGFVVFSLIHLIAHIKITELSIIQFLFYVSLSSGGYAIIRKIIKMIKGIKKELKK